MAAYAKENAQAEENEPTELKGTSRKARFQRKPLLANQKEDLQGDTEATSESKL